MHTKSQVMGAVASLIGQDLQLAMASNGYNAADFCREVAQRAFVGKLVSIDQPSIEIIRTVAERLWHGDGCTGLTDHS